MTSMPPAQSIPRELVHEFIVVFALMENALKCAGYRRGNSSSVSADWSRFAKSINWHFVRVPNKRFRIALNYMLTEPPRKQVVTDNKILLQSALPDPRLAKAERVLILVRRVRNNLYHGAKIRFLRDSNHKRDIRLMKACLVILRHSARLDRKVNDAFEKGTL